MNKYREANHWSNSPVINESDVISTIVDNAPDYYDGQIEGTARKVVKLTEIVGIIFTHLPDEAQRDVAAVLGYEVVE